MFWAPRDKVVKVHGDMELWIDKSSKKGLLISILGLKQQKPGIKRLHHNFSQNFAWWRNLYRKLKYMKLSERKTCYGKVCCYCKSFWKILGVQMYTFLGTFTIYVCMYVYIYIHCISSIIYPGNFQNWPWRDGTYLSGVLIKNWEERQY